MNHTIEHRIIASYICKECGKEINSNKCIKIGKNTYHMVCGLNKKFGKIKEKVQCSNKPHAHFSKGKIVKVCQKDVILNG